jgi:lipid II:glycine glycyltransferase (peptidoglycan interpeptide bridge formation enzyme)
MIHAANTFTYNMANDDENFNKEMASDSLEWNVMQPPNKNTGIVLLTSRAVKVC